MFNTSYSRLLLPWLGLLDDVLTCYDNLDPHILSFSLLSPSELRKVQNYASE